MVVWTVSTAVNNPVELENYYMKNYHAVDDNINDILAKQLEFDKRFAIALQSDNIHVGENRLKVVLKDTAGSGVDGANVLVRITRSETARLDDNASTQSVGGGVYESEALDFSKVGRWKAIIKVNIGEYEGYKHINLFAK